jgi:hypothetical protein
MEDLASTTASLPLKKEEIEQSVEKVTNLANALKEHAIERRQQRYFFRQERPLRTM